MFLKIFHFDSSSNKNDILANKEWKLKQNFKIYTILFL